jgi:mannitol 2-dehydrogenase
MPVPLSLATIDRLPAGVRRPGYKRDQLQAGIVHFGFADPLGVQFRACLDHLMNDGRALDWGMICAGADYFDRDIRKHIKSQNWLSTLVQGPTGRADFRVIGSVIQFLHVTDPDLYGFSTISDPFATIVALADPTIRIVSLDGRDLCLDCDTGRLNADNPLIRYETNSNQSLTVEGMILSALKLRRSAGAEPFSILCSADLPGTSNPARTAVSGLADLRDPELANWVRERVSFPQAVVDSLVALPSNRDALTELQTEIGVLDDLPILWEGPLEWVVEDHFPNGRPDLELTGVAFVEDVGPYQERKVRVFDASLAILAYPAALMGIPFLDEAAEHPLLSAFLDRVMREEVLPTLSLPPVMDAGRYLRSIQRRFQDSRRLAYQNSELAKAAAGRHLRMFGHSIEQRLVRDQPVNGLAVVTALRDAFRVTQQHPHGNQYGTPILASDTNDIRHEMLQQKGSIELFRRNAALGIFESYRRQYADQGAESLIRSYLDA